MIDFQGVFAPATTPFDPVTGDLDPVALRRNVRHLLESGLAGVLLFGSTGEGLLLDEAERAAALESVRDLASDQLILAGAAAESTRATVQLVRQSAASGADAVLVAPPAYYRPQMTPEALHTHFATVADASPVPVLLYQVPPAYSGIPLGSGLVAALANHPNIHGIKDSHGDLSALGEIVRVCRKGFAVLVGSGAVLYGGLEVGARGGILAIANLAPRECAEIFRLKREGRDAQAGGLQERLAPLHKSVVGGLGVPGVKAALDLLGLNGGSPRPPLLPLREKERNVVRGALQNAGLLS